MNWSAASASNNARVDIALLEKVGSPGW
jgi:hypothetical protein